MSSSSKLTEVKGRSVTPLERADEVSQKCFQDGVVAGALTMIPTGGRLYYLQHNNERFRKYTNFQAKTALFIMPCLFAFGVVSETGLINQMHDMAAADEHAKELATWEARRSNLEEKIRKRQAEEEGSPTYQPLTDVERQKKLQELYRKSVMESGVRIVSGDSLSLHHRVANFWQEHPFQILIGMGIPAVAAIFVKRRAGSSSLMLSQQIMQTRVMGQFTVLTFLLSLMGFKEYMDRKGKFITEEEAENRVAEMMEAQRELQFRLAEGQHEAQHVKDVSSVFHKQHK